MAITFCVFAFIMMAFCAVSIVLGVLCIITDKAIAEIIVPIFSSSALFAIAGSLCAITAQYLT